MFYSERGTRFRVKSLTMSSIGSASVSEHTTPAWISITSQCSPGRLTAQMGSTFSERIEKGDYSHKDKQAFVETVRTVLTRHAARDVGDDEIWGFLASVRYRPF